MSREVDAGGEDRWVAWLRRRSAHRGVSLIGDDAAILPDAQPWAVTVDSQIEGTHFYPGLDPAILARRLLAVNASDLAAMGALPRYAFLALATPAGFDHHRFFSALLRACRKLDLTLAGGDLARSERVSGVLTLMGCRRSHGRWVRRSEARAGENLWIGGTLGEAALGFRLVSEGARLEGRSVRLPERFSKLSTSMQASARAAVRRHLLPLAQLDLGAWLASRPHGAAIDVSDGLARDLHRLCRESDCGAEIDRDLLPTARGFGALTGALGFSVDELVLGGGEDYVLLFTLDAADAPPAALACRKIGRVVPGATIELIDRTGRRPLRPMGWDHIQVGATLKKTKGPAHHR